MFGQRTEPRPEPGHPGPVRPRLDLEGHLDRGGVSAGYRLAASITAPPRSPSAARCTTTTGRLDLGEMSVPQALMVSCDTVFYQLADEIWQKDHPRANAVTSARARCRRCRERSWAGASARPPGSTCRRRARHRADPRVAVLLLEGQATGRTGASTAGPTAPTCSRSSTTTAGPGNVWTPGQAVIASIGQGYVTCDPAAAGPRLRRPGQRRHPVQPADRPGAGQPVRPGRRKLTPAGDRAPAGLGQHPGLHPQRAGGRGHLGHRGGRLRRVPAGQGVRSGQDRHRAGGRARWPPRCSPRSRPCKHPKYVVVMMIPDSGYGADVSAPAVRQIWDGIYGLEGHQAAVPGGQVPIAAAADRGHRQDHRPEGILRKAARHGREAYRSQLGGPRPGALRPAALGADPVPGKQLRHLDWVLLAAVLALSLIGALLVWSATEPRPGPARRQPPHLPGEAGHHRGARAGHDGRISLSTTVSCGSSRRSSTAWPARPAGRAHPAGRHVNGAAGWIALPGGFQIEPSEYAKLAIILMTATLFGELREGAGDPSARRPGPSLRDAASRSPAACRSSAGRHQPELGISMC